MCSIGGGSSQVKCLIFLHHWIQLESYLPIYMPCILSLTKLLQYIVLPKLLRSNWQMSDSIWQMKDYLHTFIHGKNKDFKSKSFHRKENWNDYVVFFLNEKNQYDCMKSMYIIYIWTATTKKKFQCFNFILYLQFEISQFIWTTELDSCNVILVKDLGLWKFTKSFSRNVMNCLLSFCTWI